MLEKTDDDGKIRVHVPVVHGEYPLTKEFKGIHWGTPISFHGLDNTIGKDKASQVMTAFLDVLDPMVKSYIVDTWGEDYPYFTIETFYGTPEEYRAAAIQYVGMLVSTISDYVSGSSDDYWDYLPSAIEEVVFLCKQAGCTAVLQPLYDAIWLPGSLYNPSDMTDGLYVHLCFDGTDVVLHKDHRWALTTVI